MATGSLAERGWLAVSGQPNKACRARRHWRHSSAKQPAWPCLHSQRRSIRQSICSERTWLGREPRKWVAGPEAIDLILPEGRICRLAADTRPGIMRDRKEPAHGPGLAAGC